MTLKVAKLYRTDWSIGVTGFGTPIEESNKKLYAYFAITYRGEVILSERLDLHLRTKAVNVQLNYCEFILGYYKIDLDKMKQENLLSE